VQGQYRWHGEGKRSDLYQPTGQQGIRAEWSRRGIRSIDLQQRKNPAELKESTTANGLGNSSDHVGRYLHDSTGASRAAFLPELMNRDIYNENGVEGMHIYSPWWPEGKTLDFSRGYHLETGDGMGMPSFGFGFAVNKFNEYLGERVGGYGNQLRDDIRRFYGSRLSIACRGESVPQWTNYCELDPKANCAAGECLRKAR
jgi:hypothetical protein